MNFNLVIVYYGQISKKRCILRSLLEGGVYSCLSVNGAVVISGRRLFEIRRLLEEIRYLRRSGNI